MTKTLIYLLSVTLAILVFPLPLSRLPYRYSFLSNLFDLFYAKSTVTFTFRVSFILNILQGFPWITGLHCSPPLPDLGFRMPSPVIVTTLMAALLGINITVSLPCARWQILQLVACPANPPPFSFRVVEVLAENNVGYNLESTNGAAPLEYNL